MVGGGGGVRISRYCNVGDGKSGGTADKGSKKGFLVRVQENAQKRKKFVETASPRKKIRSRFCHDRRLKKGNCVLCRSTKTERVTCARRQGCPDSGRKKNYGKEGRTLDLSMDKEKKITTRLSTKWGREEEARLA